MEVMVKGGINEFEGHKSPYVITESQQKKLYDEKLL